MINNNLSVVPATMDRVPRTEEGPRNEGGLNHDLRDLHKDEQDVRNLRHDMSTDRTKLNDAIEDGNALAAQKYARDLAHDQNQLNGKLHDIQEDKAKVAADRRDIQHDLKDIRADGREIRHLRQDMAQDRTKLDQAIDHGNAAEAAKYGRDLANDQRELDAKLRDLRRDQADLRRDER